MNTTSGAVRKFADLAERAAATYLEVLVGLLLAGGLFNVGAVDRISTATQAAVAAIPAGLSVIKSALSGWLGNKTTVSALPASLDPATPDA